MAAPLATSDVPVEIAPLVEAMNGLILRLRAALDAQKQFVADAAHELRTPLAAMQAQVDALARTDGSASVEGPSAVSAGLRRASHLVDQLLRLARLDDQVRPAAEPIDLGSLLLDCVADHAVLAERACIDLGAGIEASATIHGTEAEIRTLVASLLDNAVRYTLPADRSMSAYPGRMGVASSRFTTPGMASRRAAKIAFSTASSAQRPKISRELGLVSPSLGGWPSATVWA